MNENICLNRAFFNYMKKLFSLRIIYTMHIQYVTYYISYKIYIIYDIKMQTSWI